MEMETGETARLYSGLTVHGVLKGPGELSGCSGPLVTVGTRRLWEGKCGCVALRGAWGGSEVGSPFFSKAPVEI